MLKQILLPAFAALTLTAAVVPAANAGITLNGITLNGITLNGITLNGITLNGVALNGPGDLAAVRPVRLTLPDGGQLAFR
jgi:hypothetical protein